MLVHLLVALLTQAPGAGDPQVAVVVTQRTNISEKAAEGVATKIAEALAVGGVALAGTPKQSAAQLAAAGTRNPSECQGKRGCVSGLARLLRVWGVIGVEVADLDGTLAVHLQLIDADGERHAEMDLVLPTKRAENEVGAQVLPLAEQVRRKLAAAKPAPPPPAEPARVEAPPPQPAPSPEIIEVPAKRSPVPLVLTFGFAAVAAGTAVAFLILAGNSRSALMRETSMMPYGITRAEAEGLARRANDGYTIALACGIGAAALVLLGTVLGLVQ